MSIKIVNGDLLDATESILGHQVNCQGVMGSGIALALRERHRGLFPRYKQFCGGGVTPDSLLGRCQLVSCEGKIIANLFGQLSYGRGRIRYTDYGSLETALTELKEIAKFNNLSVALPFNIGCGLANGDWHIVREIISEAFIDYEVTLYRI